MTNPAEGATPKPDPLELTKEDREMIDAVIDGHYEVHGSAVKGDLHGSLYAAGRNSMQSKLAEANALYQGARAALANTSSDNENSLRTQLECTSTALRNLIDEVRTTFRNGRIPEDLNYRVRLGEEALSGVKSDAKPYKLPCDVRLPPATTIRKGCDLSTLLAALEARDGENAEFRDEKPAAVPEDYCIMPKELTAENGMKAALIGEFFEEITVHDEDGDECQQRVDIRWTTIKEIYKAAVAHFSAAPEAQPVPAPKDDGGQK